MLGASGRSRARHAMAAMHRTRMQQPGVAKDEGEPEREERGQGTSPAGAAGHASRILAPFPRRTSGASPTWCGENSAFETNLSRADRVEFTKGPEDTMISPKSLRQFAAYSISLPAFAVSPKLAKETVYMPSQVAAQTLGVGEIRATPQAPVNDNDKSERNGKGRI